MKELFNVKFHPNNGYGFTMNMVYGSLDVPDEKGCYVLSTGCGSGKTECCMSIIGHRANDGILYCVDTIAELNKMYQWVVSHGKVYIGYDKFPIKRYFSYPDLWNNTTIKYLKWHR